MKIIFLTTQLSTQDGWGRYAVSLIEQTMKKGIACEALVSVWAKKSDLPQIKTYNILPPFPAKRFFKIYYLLKNIKKIKKIISQADIVHVLAEPMSLFGFIAKNDKPLIVSLHGTYAVNPLKKWYLKKIYAYIFRQVQKIICVSKFTQQEFLKLINIDHTIVINNGINFDRFQKQNNYIRKDHNDKIILSVGALTFRKGYHISIPAVAQAISKHSNVKYIIVGSQKNQLYFQKLKKIANEYKLDKKVNFLEDLTDKQLIDLYYQSDLFLLTPVNIDDNFEGFGLVYLEANACGKPAIGTYGCGAEEAINNDFSGLLVEQNDIKATSKAILKIFEDDKLADNLSQNARHWAQEHDWSYVVLKYLEIYKQF